MEKTKKVCSNLFGEFSYLIQMCREIKTPQHIHSQEIKTILAFYNCKYPVYKSLNKKYGKNVGSHSLAAIFKVSEEFEITNNHSNYSFLFLRCYPVSLAQIKPKKTSLIKGINNNKRNKNMLM